MIGLLVCPGSVVRFNSILCPSADPQTGQWKCLESFQLCNGKPECPNGEDENPRNCFIYGLVSIMHINYKIE